MENVKLGIQFKSVTRWESRIKFIKPLWYDLADELKFLEQLEELFKKEFFLNWYAMLCNH